VSRLFKTRPERKKGIWKSLVDLALTDVRVVAGGLDEASLEALEETLLRADFGVPATLRLVDRAEAELRRGKVRGQAQLIDALKSEIREILGSPDEGALRLAESGPTVYMIVGVNGVGKTTSVAKLAHWLKGQGHSVMVAAADTFRAGAVAQLELWAQTIGVDFLKGQQGGDPAAVAFDALDAAEARGTDVVLIDTAGRLHTNRGLMQELEKIDRVVRRRVEGAPHRVVRRRVEGAPHETLMVLDATVGQNAIRQFEAFEGAVDVSGIILAKMDSSSRGGIVVALRQEHGVPVKLVGTGEGLEDLSAFDADAFVEAVFASDS
jgi:fused signal recognition particle receptor